MSFRSLCRRFFAALAAASLSISALPGAVFALEGTRDTYVKIQTREELTSGEYVLVNPAGWALGKYDESLHCVSAVEPVMAEDTLADPLGAVWTLTVTDTGVTLRDSGGVFLSPLEGGESGITAGEYIWNVTLEETGFVFRGMSGELPVVLAQNGDLFRAYDESILTEDYPAAFSLYRQMKAAPEPEIPDFILTCTGEGTVGSTLTFSPEPAVEGISYAIRLDNGNWETLPGNTFSIPKGQPGKHTLEVKGTAGNESHTLTISYTIEQPEETPTDPPEEPSTDPSEEPETPSSQPTDPIPPAPLVAEGDYVIRDAENEIALSTRRFGGTSNYFEGTPAVWTEGGLTGCGNTEIWSVSVSDGRLTITGSGETLGMGDRYASISHADGYTGWVPEAGENGSLLLKNAVTGRYLAYDPTLGFWTSAENAAGASFLTLTPAQREDKPPEETEPTEEQQTVSPVTITPAGGNVFFKGESLSVTLTCETEEAEIYYAASSDGETYGEFARYTQPLTLSSGFGQLHLRAFAQKALWKDSAETSALFTERKAAGEGIYFGLLHSHSSYSKGTQSPEDLYAAAAEDMDFYAITDHSNSLDNSELGSIGADAASISAEWTAGKAAAREATQHHFVAIYGYEMAWPELRQLGHLSTFGTPGFESWMQPAYKDTADALSAYYNALTTVPDGVTQFNHPGDNYGDFQAFDHYSEKADAAITLLELGEALDITYYLRALENGWHVSPTFPPDGGAGRTAVLAQSLTETGILDALKNYRTYATQDSDLSIVYTLDGYEMGTLLEKRDVGSTLELALRLTDPTDSGSAAVEVIADGETIREKTMTGNSLTLELPGSYRYYFLRITQADGDIAVTAPVWVDDTEDAGIRSFTADTLLPVQGEELNLTLSLYNQEDCDLLIDTITVTIGGETVYKTDEGNRVRTGGTERHTFPLTCSALGETTLCATVTATLDGAARSYRSNLTLNFQRADLVTGLLVDGTHGNAGVDQLDDLTALADQAQISVTVAREEITADLLGQAKMLLVSAPDTAFEDSFLKLVRNFAETGGTVIVCGQSDSLDGSLHTSQELNRLLSAIGSTLRIRDDQARDTTNNGGRDSQLYLGNVNTGSAWCAYGNPSQVYRHVGATVDPGSGIWLVQGSLTTDSADADRDGGETAAMGQAVVLACEGTPSGGTVFASGSLFLSDENLEGPKNIWDEPYWNRAIAKALLGVKQAELPLSTISSVRQGSQGEVYRIRGYATSCTSDPYNTFSDTLYLQDDTGGIAVVSFHGAGIEIGTPLEVTGYLDNQGGNLVLEQMSWSELNVSPYRYVPAAIPNGEAMNYALHGGELLQVEGEVVQVTKTGTGGLSRIVLADAQGDLAAVLVEAEILSGSTGRNTLAEEIKIGRQVRAMGLLHIHSDGKTVLRVRNCDEVVRIDPNPYTPDRDKDNPPTGDSAPLYIAAMPLAAGVVLMLRRRKR